MGGYEARYCDADGVHGSFEEPAAEPIYRDPPGAGVSVDKTLVNVEGPNGYVKAGGVNADLYAGPDGFELGGGVTAVEGGWKPNPKVRFDSKRSNDRSTGASLSVGPSAGASYRVKDVDGDGVDEHCVKVTGGPVSVEHCTESPKTDAAAFLANPALFMTAMGVRELITPNHNHAASAKAQAERMNEWRNRDPLREQREKEERELGKCVGINYVGGDCVKRLPPAVPREPMTRERAQEIAPFADPADVMRHYNGE